MTEAERNNLHESEARGFMSTPYKPNTNSTVSPYLIVDGASNTIAFLESGGSDLPHLVGRSRRALSAVPMVREL